LGLEIQPQTAILPARDRARVRSTALLAAGFARTTLAEPRASTLDEAWLGRVRSRKYPAIYREIAHAHGARSALSAAPNAA
jgi:hypothetical protein